MSNMSYCRFENTFRDLQDCYEHMHAREGDGDDDLSEREAKYRARLVKLCHDIANDWDE